MKKRYLLILAFILLFASNAFSQGPLLILYGGENNETFLGFLNASRYDTNSIWNFYGNYGSRYTSNSIWNRYGTYGSKYNNYSPWNKYGSKAPVIVDNNGNFYGHFSSNKYHKQRTRIDFCIALLDNYDWVIDNLEETRDRLGF